MPKLKGRVSAGTSRMSDTSVVEKFCWGKTWTAIVCSGNTLPACLLTAPCPSFCINIDWAMKEQLCSSCNPLPSINAPNHNHLWKNIYSDRSSAENTRRAIAAVRNQPVIKVGALPVLVLFATTLRADPFCGPILDHFHLNSSDNGQDSFFYRCSFLAIGLLLFVLNLYYFIE